MIRIGLVGLHQLRSLIETSEQFEIVFDVDGNQARKYLESTPVDVVITELVMAGEDGFALLEKYRDVRFIVASELKSEVFVIKALELGAKYYLVRPVEYSVLEQRIQNVADGDKLGSKVMRKKTVSEKTLDERISSIFVSVGIPAHIKGYQFLREGIKLAVDNPSIINAITKSLYPTIARRFDTTSSKVERAIRHAIEVAWNRGKIENIKYIWREGVHLLRKAHQRRVYCTACRQNATGMCLLSDMCKRLFVGRQTAKNILHNARRYQVTFTVETARKQTEMVQA